MFNAIPIPPIPLKALSTTFSTNLLLPWVISLPLQSTSLYIYLNSYVEPIFTCGCNYNQPSSTIYRLLPSGHILAVLSWLLHGRCQPEPSYYIFFSASTSSISHNGQSDWLCKRLGNCWSEIFRRERIYKVFFCTIISSVYSTLVCMLARAGTRGPRSENARFIFPRILV